MQRIAATSTATHATQLAAGIKTKHVLTDGTQVNFLRTGVDRYAVSKSRGRGHFGKLRYAVNTRGQTFAVKEFRLPERLSRRPDATHPSTLKAILAETFAVKDFGGALQLHDVANVQGKVYMFTPLMLGTINDLRDRALPSSRHGVARQVMGHVSRQLQAMYQRGYVHRDVKDANILCAPNGSFVLCDFGMVEPIAAMTSSGSGTWGFMPPEYVHHGQVHPRYDVFSLGISLADIHARHLRLVPTSKLQNVVASSSLLRWRKTVVDPRSGRVDVGRMGCDLFWSADERHWNRYFRCLRCADPQLCQFIVERMLEPRPTHRASIFEVRQMAAVLLAQAPLARQQVAEAVNSVRNPGRDATLASLHRARQRGILSPRVALSAS